MGWDIQAYKQAIVLDFYLNRSVRYGKTYHEFEEKKYYSFLNHLKKIFKIPILEKNTCYDDIIYIQNKRTSL